MVKAIIFLYEPDLSSLPSLSVPGSAATTWLTSLGKYFSFHLTEPLSHTQTVLHVMSLTVERVKPI